MQPYDDDFYAEGDAHALRSARRLVPEVLRLLPVRSVVDVGCGLGAWLSVFVEHGALDVLGVDGAHVRQAALHIGRERFLARDLGEPLTLDRRFELAMSVEVAEHLPAVRASGFVADLCRAAPAVLFSAAVPSQGGVHHVNEQWPDYWALRFAAHGYTCIDAFRGRAWDDPDVSWWYAQNLLLYVDRHTLRDRPALAALASDQLPRRLAHPQLVERNLHRKRLQDTLLDLLGRAPAGGRVLVADGAQLPAEGRALARFTWLPFLEREGTYWGAPADSPHAVAELERMRAEEGATALAFVWPCLWWLDAYPGLIEHLERGYRHLGASQNVVVWDLAAPGT